MKATRGLAFLFLSGVLVGCSSSGGGGGTPDPPDWSGTWVGSHHNPGGPGSETLTVVIQNVECANGICLFDGTWTTPTYVAALDDDYLYDVNTGAPGGFSWTLDYTAGCGGIDLAGGDWYGPVSQIQGNTNGDCNSSSLFTLNPP